MFKKNKYNDRLDVNIFDFISKQAKKWNGMGKAGKKKKATNTLEFKI